MTNDERIELVRKLMISSAKTRSNISEYGSDNSVWNSVQHELTPWLFGEHTIMEACELIINRGTCTAMDMRNVLTIAHVLDPMIAFGYGIIWMEDLPLPEFVTLEEMTS